MKMVDSYLGSDLEIEGKVKLGKKSRIDGCCKGYVEAKGELDLGPNALIEGELKGESMVMGGKLKGAIHASKTLLMTESGRVEGNTFTPPGGFRLNRGAQCEGTIEMASPVALKLVEGAEEG